MGVKLTRPVRPHDGQGGSVLPMHDAKSNFGRRDAVKFKSAFKFFLPVVLVLCIFLYLDPAIVHVLWSLSMRWLHHLLEVSSLLAGVGKAVSAPSGFPRSGNGLWYTAPGASWVSELLPIGNGYLAAMVPGGTQQEVTQLNIESLWSGGPFADPSYNGSNKAYDQQSQLAQDMRGIRSSIFSSPTGTIDNVEVLAAPIGAYGSYAGAGYLISTLDIAGTVSNYARWLDMDSALVHAQWTQNGSSFLRTSFCSYPAQACVEHINTTSHSLPGLTYAFSSYTEVGLPVPKITCLDQATLQVRGQVADPGMKYEILGRVQAAGTRPQINCTSSEGTDGIINATISVLDAQEAWITWVGDTEYSMDAGNAAHSFNFRGSDPHSKLINIISTSAPAQLNSTTFPSNAYSNLLSQHVTDYQTAIGGFELDLGQIPNLDTPTDQIVNAYATDVGDLYVEWLLFNFGRYLLVGSARGTLPANLQGKWGDGISNAWGADANINTQMNYWAAETTNLNVTQSLWDYMEKTWAPRGSETAQILYNITKGWVTHNEMNIFGHTGMKLSGNSAQWADYPESAVWMMIHVWDHFDYTGDVAWWKAQGWPLLKSVAEFHLEKLIPDEHFNDSTLVVAPCNSPEQTPITFGCAHAQQLIWQLLNAAEKGFDAAGDTDQAFLAQVRSIRAQMDKGIHIGSWGQLQEWKLDMDSPTDTHRHLSHLVGLYPGYAVANFADSVQGSIAENGTLHNYTRADVLGAATVSLIHRGNGTGPDADSGWEKIWRAAAWAQLGNATEFYHELSYAIDVNYAGNLFSLYSSGSTIFQIDANLGYPAAVMNALVQAPDVASYSIPLTVTLLPALPSKWASGSVIGARIRGGLRLDMQWREGNPTMATITSDRDDGQSRLLNVVYAGKAVGSFRTGAGAFTHSISF
ncbi:hypothetical protein EW146_g9406 [Bondarzewia mesenterica]|uniref:Uncharacterized protein n=1 Tax=Bondarzewia mesenterica TaxID=1095465 RepID=A0A4S4L6L5_9AGAM|nr:hypothetical protein EW146_g9406 [Bondarzewia mesenterica]